MRLYDKRIMSASTATEYTDIFSEDIGQLLDQLAPLRAGNRRKLENDCRWQTDDSREARRLSRKLERRYLKRHKDSDRRAYNSARRASNVTSKRARVHDLLHSRQKSELSSEDECRRLS